MKRSQNIGGLTMRAIAMRICSGQMLVVNMIGTIVCAVHSRYHSHLYCGVGCCRHDREHVLWAGAQWGLHSADLSEPRRPFESTHRFAPPHKLWVQISAQPSQVWNNRGVSNFNWVLLSHVLPYIEISPIFSQLFIDFLLFLLSSRANFAVLVGFGCKQIMQICGYELLLEKSMIVGVRNVEQALSVQIRLQGREMTLFRWRAIRGCCCMQTWPISIIRTFHKHLQGNVSKQKVVMFSRFSWINNSRSFESFRQLTLQCPRYCSTLLEMRTTFPLQVMLTRKVSSSFIRPSVDFGLIRYRFDFWFPNTARRKICILIKSFHRSSYEIFQIIYQMSRRF